MDWSKIFGAGSPSNDNQNGADDDVLLQEDILGEDGASDDSLEGDEGDQNQQTDMRAVLNELAEVRKQLAAVTANKDGQPDRFEVPASEFITQQDFEAMQGGDFKVLNSAINKAIQYGAQLTHQELLKRNSALIDERLMTAVPQQVTLTNFWERNRDLVQHQKIVTRVFQAIEEENPSMPLRDKLAKAAKITRKRLGLNDGSQQNRQGPTPLGGIGARNVNQNRRPKDKSVADELSTMASLVGIRTNNGRK